MSRVGHRLSKTIAGLLLSVAVVSAATAGLAWSAPFGAYRGEPRFIPIHGWHVTTIGSVTGRVGRSASAATIPFAMADSGSSAPVKTVATLPKHGILLWAQFQETGHPAIDSGFPVRRLPLRLDQTRVSGTPEMFAAPGKVLHLDARAHGYDIFIYIFFGSRKPTAAMLAAANRQLGSLSLPT